MLVVGAGVIVCFGVDVDFTVARLVKVKPKVVVGTGVFDVLPNEVVQREIDLVVSPKTKGRVAKMA